MPNRKIKERRSKFSKLPTSRVDTHFILQIKVLVSLILILISLYLLNAYISLKFSKTNPKFNSSIKNNLVKLDKGSIQIDPALMKESNVLEQPTRILMPSAGIDINVIEAEVKDGFWETSETTASHGMGSADPGQNGNSVIFAHARVGLFYNLKDLKKDDLVYVFTDKKWFAYKVTDITSVYPDQVEVIAPTKDQRLTLYTCTGYADEKRLIVVAKPIKT